MGKLITLSLPTQVEVELGCDNVSCYQGRTQLFFSENTTYVYAKYSGYYALVNVIQDHASSVDIWYLMVDYDSNQEQPSFTNMVYGNIALLD